MSCMAQAKKITSIRLTAEARELRIALAQKLGLNASAVLELAIRKLADAEGVTLKPKARKPKAAA
jgi:hypothetical protein